MQVVPCLALFDTMKYINSDVGTVGFGGCMGMSGFLLAVGKKVRCKRPCRDVSSEAEVFLETCRCMYCHLMAGLRDAG